MKIGVHLLKLWPKNKVAVFWNTVYNSSVLSSVEAMRTNLEVSDGKGRSEDKLPARTRRQPINEPRGNIRSIHGNGK